MHGRESTMESRGDRDPTTLLIRHLPEKFSNEKKIEFCQYYGAVSTTVMPNKGKMKHCAFAYFPDPASATNALHKLHQMTILGRTLSVEYARRTESQRHRSNDIAPGHKNLKEADILSRNSESTRTLLDKMQDEQQVFLEGPISLLALSEKLGLRYPLNPTLRYNYPKPTQQIIMNIANTLASVPKFYTQVLHLMNKMNLPAPFSLNSFPAPPLPPEEIQKPPEPEEMEISSEEESELESDEESQEKRPKDVLPLKRPSKHRSTKPKRPRLDQLLAASKSVPKGDTSGQVINPSEVFEEPAVSLKKPEIRLAEGIATALNKPVQGDVAQELLQPHPGGKDVTGSFGTFTPAPPSSRKEDEGEASEEEEESSDFIKKEQLRNKISKEEMKKMSVFKNYSPGEPNTRLYIKNLAKQVEEKDIKFIFGRYVDWTSALDKDMFSIQLMKQGRMKGQAFVALPSEFAAKKAVKETNGYLLQGKPLVVVFARSAKPKPTPVDKKS